MLSLSGTLEMLRRRDVVAIGIDAIAHLDSLAPVVVPPNLTPSLGLSRFLRGQCTAGELVDAERLEYQEWLACADVRARAREENRRRLRHTLWAEVTLRDRGESEGASILRAWHAEHWGLADPASSHLPERERQVTACVRRFMR